MRSVDETRALILAHAPALSREVVPLAQALHRVLREEARADADSPRFSCSAMDGYALRSREAGSRLRVAGEVPAGAGARMEIAPGECARIYTGGRLPLGADCVAMQEDVAVEEGGWVRVPAGLGDEHVRHQGENYRAGDVLVAAGRRLTAAECAILAGCGVTAPSVTRRAAVVHFATGDELVAPEETPAGAQIRDTNSTLVQALLGDRAVHLVRQQRVGDSLAAAGAAMAQAGEGSDVILISGGASVGEYDFTRPMLQAAGFTIHLEKVNMRPGKPLVFATRGAQLAFGLPGNPVSHWAIYHLFLAPLFTALSGAPVPAMLRQGRVRADFAPPASARETYWPARAEWEDGCFRLTPLRFTSSGDAAGLAGANALLRIPAGSAAARDAEWVDFVPCDPW